MTIKEAIAYVQETRKYLADPHAQQDSKGVEIGPFKKLDRNRWWCAHCNDMAAKQSMIRHGENYCCNCGCPLTEEAWAELERRINDESTDN